MGLLDAIGGVVEGIGLSDIVGDFFGGSFDFLGPNLGGFTTDVLSGAVTNAAVSGLAGGDIGKAALFGAVGGGIGDSSLGGWGNEISGAVSGYGLADSLDGNGLTGAFSGAAGAFLNDKYRSSSTSSSPPAKNANKNVAQNGSAGPQNPQNPQQTGGANTANQGIGGGSSSGAISQRLKSLGLINQNGDGTLLGKALVSGIGSMAEQKTTEDVMEQQTEQRKEVDRNQAELDHEMEQRRIAAFTGKKPRFKVTRNG